MKKTGSNKKCLYCNDVFYAPLWLEKNGGAKFCSHKCYSLHKHDEPWNKGTKGLVKKNSGSFGHVGSKWNGTLSEYKYLHYWISKYLGKSNICTQCKNEYIGNKMHWANISGEYKKDPNDWIRLCARCHYNFDNTERRRGI